MPVPMAKMENTFNQFQYLHIPVPVSANSSIWIKPHHDMLVITGDKIKFTTVPSASLATCHNTGAHYLRPDSNTYQMLQETTWALCSKNTCLFKLY
jgi:hypothetical protein